MARDEQLGAIMRSRRSSPSSFLLIIAFPIAVFGFGAMRTLMTSPEHRSVAAGAHAMR